MKTNRKQSNKKVKKKFNLYGWMQRNKKVIVSTVCVVVAFTLILGTLSSMLVFI